MSTSLKKVIGIADCCEMLGITWAFPTKELVEGICDGAVSSDMIASMEDAGIDVATAHKLVERFQRACLAECGQTEGERCAKLFETMRHVYTRLYLTPGGKTPVQPYESAFLFEASGAHGVPTLFVSRTTTDVEACMREAGVRAKNARKEPSDAIWNEFSYLAFAYGSLACAMQQEDLAAVCEWQEHIRVFLDKHALAWLPCFMEKTEQASESYSLPPIYSDLAKISKAILDMIAA